MASAAASASAPAAAPRGAPAIPPRNGRRPRRAAVALPRTAPSRRTEDRADHERVHLRLSPARTGGRHRKNRRSPRRTAQLRGETARRERTAPGLCAEAKQAAPSAGPRSTDPSRTSARGGPEGERGNRHALHDPISEADRAAMTTAGSSDASVLGRARPPRRSCRKRRGKVAPSTPPWGCRGRRARRPGSAQVRPTRSSLHRSDDRHEASRRKREAHPECRGSVVAVDRGSRSTPRMVACEKRKTFGASSSAAASAPRRSKSVVTERAGTTARVRPVETSVAPAPARHVPVGRSCDVPRRRSSSWLRPRRTADRSRGPTTPS
jgi:hypothetical protein